MHNRSLTSGLPLFRLIGFCMESYGVGWWLWHALILSTFMSGKETKQLRYLSSSYFQLQNNNKLIQYWFTAESSADTPVQCQCQYYRQFALLDP